MTSSQLPTEEKEGRDPLAGLHKMSRTAGLGTTDYVAVNTMAVAALLLGLASALTVFGMILLILPVVTLVVAIIALRQISRSAGTQTGRGIALLGLVLAVGWVLYVGGRYLIRSQNERAEQQHIIELISAMGRDMNQANYDAAWERFSDRFKESRKKDEFVTLWTRMQAYEGYGKIKGMRWNEILDVQLDDPSGIAYARGFVLIDLENGREDRRESQFRKDPEKGWQFDDIQGFAPGPARPAGM